MARTIGSKEREAIRCECGRQQTIVAANEPGGVTLLEAQVLGWVIDNLGGARCPFCAGNTHMLRRVFDTMKLVDLHPRWAIDADIVIGGVARHYDNRDGMAISFDCPCCVGTSRATRLAVWFRNPIDGLPPTDDAQKLWRRHGETFETLTLSPSIDASAYGHWHGFIVDGAAK